MVQTANSGLRMGTAGISAEPASFLRDAWGWDRSGSQWDKDPARDIRGMPPNFGQGALPHVITFQGIISSVARVYRPSDEAIQDSRDNARFMRNDPTVMECIEQRQRSCALLDWHLEPQDENDPEQQWLVQQLTRLLEEIPHFLQYRENLLHAVWYGRYGVQHRWRWREVDGIMRLCMDRWLPVNGDKLVFRYDDGTGEYHPDQVGIRVGAGFTVGSSVAKRWAVERINKVEPTDYGLAYFLEHWERPLLAIHRHYIEDGEYEAPETAGKVHGVGIRSRMYWAWYQKQEALALLMDYIERTALGIEIWYYPWGNPDAKAKTQTAAEERIGEGRNIVLVPRPLGEEGQAYGVDRIEPGGAGADALNNIISEYFGHLIKRYILGQTLTSEASATGLGSNLADVHLDTYMQIVKYDAVNLEETITEDLVKPLQRWNFPKYAKVPVKFRIDVETEDSEKKLEAYKAAWEMGAKLRERDILDLVGAASPTADDEVLQHPSYAQGGMGMEGMMGGNGAMPDGSSRSMFSFDKAAADTAILLQHLRERHMVAGDDNPTNPESDGGERERLNKYRKPAPGQRSFWDESQHPRDPEGKFAEKERTGQIREIISELEEKGWGVPRHDMPQITKGDAQDFLDELAKRGVENREIELPAGELKGIQKELNQRKVAGMVDRLEREGIWGGSGPIASRDGYILDGHHRWAAQRVYDENSPFKVTQVDLDIQDLLDAAYNFDRVQFAGVQHSEPVKPPKPKPSRAKVSVGRWKQRSQMAAKRITKRLGLDEKSIGSLVGAPDDATVTYEDAGGNNGIQVRVRSDNYYATREIRTQGWGPNAPVVMWNAGFTVKPDKRGQGIGTRMFAKQALNASAAGITEISTSATPDNASGTVGYVVWPKLGYDAKLPPWTKRKLPENLAHADTVQDLYQTKAGRDWWAEHGTTQTMTFDTTPGSRSMRILERYLRRKRAAERVPEQFSRRPTRLERYTGGPKPPMNEEPTAEEPDLSPEDEKILEEIWDQIGAETADRESYARRKPAAGQRSLWDESKHPRDSEGKFSETEGGAEPEDRSGPPQGKKTRRGSSLAGSFSQSETPWGRRGFPATQSSPANASTGKRCRKR